jgi:hypothetical protein
MDLKILWVVKVNEHEPLVLHLPLKGLFLLDHHIILVEPIY